MAKSGSSTDVPNNKAIDNGTKGFKDVKRTNNKENKKEHKKSMRQRVSPRQYALVFFTLLIVYLIVRVIAYPSYYFDFNTLLTSLAEMPTINITSILSWELAFPSWLSWLEDILLVLSFIAGALANTVVFFVGFLRFLFLA